MSPQIPSELVERFVKFLEKDLGLFYPAARHPELLNRLSSSLKLSDSELNQYMKDMTTNQAYKKEHFDELAEVLTIAETYFFRPGCGIEELEKTILPEIIAKKQNIDKTIRIWSAGCCTGDEPYSIAILLDKMLALQKDWNIQILGTDISKRSLKRAEKGIIRPWSFRTISDDIVSAYFIKKGENEYEIIDRIRSMVTFSYLNLVEDFYPSLENGTNGLDVLLCNNTLIYLSADQIKKSIKKFVNCLLDDGYLIVSPAEASFVQDGRLSQVNSCNVFTKGEEKKKIEKPETKPVARPKPVLPTQPKPETKPTISIEDMYEAGDYEECINKLKETPSLDEKKSAILIRSYANVGKLERAEKLCRDKVSQNTLAPLFHFLLANILQEQDHSDEAILELKRALFLDSDYIMAHFSLAYLLHLQKKEKESEVHRRVVLEKLANYEKDAIVPGSEHMSAGRLKEITTSMESA